MRFKAMRASFLTNAKIGNNSWWRYCLGIFLSLACWVACYSLISDVWDFFLPFPIETGSDLSADQPLQKAALQQALVGAYIVNTAPFIFLCMGLWMTIRGLHGRRLRSLITANQFIDWQRLIAAFGVWFGLAGLQTIIEFCIHPKDFFWSFDLIQWLKFLPLALVLTPIQTSAEELFFRGYLLQGLGLMIRQPIVLTLSASLPFALVHFGNPEMQRGAIWLALTYGVLAVFLTVITLKDGRLELALGVHAANNLFIVLVVNTQDSALRSPSIVTQAIATDPKVTFFALLITVVVFYALFFGKPTR